MLAGSRPRTAGPCRRRCTSWARRVLEAHPEVAEIKFSAPNKHHFLVDLDPFGLENNGEVFIAADRPYGLIEAPLSRDDSSDARAGLAGRSRLRLMA